MCGRYTLTDPARFFAEFNILEKRPTLEPRFNIAPDQRVPVVRIVAPEPSARVDMLIWGLVPKWVTDPTKRAASGLINARIETVATKPSFAGAFRDRRCLVVADGFYEWKKTEKRRLPHHIRMPDSGPFAMAGIWEPMAPAIGRDADSFAIITRPALPPVDSLHDRMPAILDPGDVETWLDPRIHDVASLKLVLGRGSERKLTISPASLRVNSPANDDPGCLDPAAGEEIDRGVQRRLF
jgi:putative SOS response-associated peptidase YedK